MMYRLGMAMLVLMLATTSAGFSLEPRIIGGTAENNPPEFMVFLILDESHICGGSYIGGNRILTAAHCLDGISSVEVALDTVGGNWSTAGTTWINSTYIMMHPEYDSRTMDNDVAIVFLESAPPSTVSPVKLASKTVTNSLIGGVSQLTALGWGVTDTGNSTQQLQTVDLTYETNQDCNDTYRELSGISINGNMICAGAADDDKDSCFGDSGGPLLYSDGGSTYLVGLTSFGLSDCAMDGVSGVYARVANYIEWINGMDLGAAKISTHVVAPRTGNGSFGFGLLIILLGGLLVRRR